MSSALCSPPLPTQTQENSNPEYHTTSETFFYSQQQLTKQTRDAQGKIFVLNIKPGKSQF